VKWSVKLRRIVAVRTCVGVLIGVPLTALLLRSGVDEWGLTCGMILVWVLEAVCAFANGFTVAMLKDLRRDRSIVSRDRLKQTSGTNRQP
jgi:hypothetical protein